MIKNRTKKHLKAITILLLISISLILTFLACILLSKIFATVIVSLYLIL